MGEQVKCHICRHRLFDLRSEEIELIIKCPECRKLLHVLGKQNEIKIMEIK